MMMIPLKKAPTGINGLDEVTHGGLPQGRPTLVCGGPGTGKSVFGMEFLVRGATMFNEPGLYVSFEECPEDIIAEFTTLGFPFKSLIRKKKLLIDHVIVEAQDIEEGQYDLGGLFVRLDHSIKKIGAKRIVLDNIEALFSSFTNVAIVRAEIKRLLEWLRERKVTVIVTAESTAHEFTRRGIEAFITDCVLFLDHRVREQVSTRLLRVVKYRGSSHETNEYPFFIATGGITAIPIKPLALTHIASKTRLSSGLPELDAMLGGKGFFSDSIIVISGPHGSGKSSLTTTIAAAAAQRGERCLYFSFEESESQLVRGMTSIGLKLAPLIKAGRLVLHCNRPTLFGIESQWALMLKHIIDFKPMLVVIDPVNNLMTAGSEFEVRGMLMRLVDSLKMRHIACVFNFVIEEKFSGVTEAHVTALMDVWIYLRTLSSNGTRNTTLEIIETRGSNHSNKVAQFALTDKGIRIGSEK